MRPDEVCVVGAGPFGLTTAAHLRAAGLSVRVFGDVMSFWRSMPAGMLLRSTRDGISLYDPDQGLSLDDYERFQAKPLTTPIERSEFIQYVQWFQRHAVPEIDPRMIETITPLDSGFRVLVSDGEAFDVARVVLAVGLDSFRRTLPMFDGMDPGLTAHSLELRDCSPHEGKRVMVVGSGQSAVESCALLHQSGATVELVARGPEVCWLGQADHINRESGIVAHVLYPPGAIGPPGINWIVQLPWLYRSLPKFARDRVFERAVRPAASGRLRPLLVDVRQTYGRSIAGAEILHRQVRVHLDDGSDRIVDHVVQATGFEIDISRLSILSEPLRRQIRVINGNPLLSAGFESSVPGLHFVGATSELSFGPLMRAIAGTRYTATSVAKRAAGAMDRVRRTPIEMIGQGVGMMPALMNSTNSAAAVVGALAPALGMDGGMIDQSIQDVVPPTA